MTGGTTPPLLVVGIATSGLAVADSVATVDGPVIQVETSAGGCNERDSSWIGGQSAHIGSTAGLGLGKRRLWEHD